MTNKIPPGEYSVDNGKLHHSEGKYRLLDFIEGPAVTGMAIATIGFSMPGIPQLQIRERSAEEVLDEYLSGFKGTITYERALQAMHAYRSQPIAPVSEEEMQRMAQKAFANGIAGDTHFDYLQSVRREAYIEGLADRTQSGYTREQVLQAVSDGLAIGYAFNIDNRQDVANKIIASLTPSITSVTIGEENNIVNVKYK